MFPKMFPLLVQQSSELVLVIAQVWQNISETTFKSFSSQKLRLGDRFQIFVKKYSYLTNSIYCLLLVQIYQSLNHQYYQLQLLLLQAKKSLCQIANLNNTAFCSVSGGITSTGGTRILVITELYQKGLYLLNQTFLYYFFL